MQPEVSNACNWDRRTEQASAGAWALATL